jgi:signal transduction histidine kinase
MRALERLAGGAWRQARARREILERRGLGVSSSLRGDESHVLAEEQAALRRVAALVARGVPPEEVFAAVTEELGRLLSVKYAHLGRYESDGTVIIVAGSDRGGEHVPVGGKNVITHVFETGRPARIDGYADDPGPVGVSARKEGVGAGVGTPVIVEGRLWGVMAVHSPLGQPLPADTETRLANFTELVATAIANAESRSELARLAEEQAALRRVATLVARGTPSEQVFAAVTEELGRLIGADIARLARFESGNTAVLAVAVWAKEEGDRVDVGTLVPIEDSSLASMVLRTGRPTRTDNQQPPDSTSARARQLGVTSTVGTPIVVEGRLWGGMTVSSKQPEPLPPDTESRIADFAELVATAIANAESRTELAESRARIVTASDDTRRRIERDLHDGVQQRLVTLALVLRTAQAELPPGLEKVSTELSGVVEGLNAALNELREIARGIHPAILSEKGLVTALKAVARRSPIPVELDVRVEGPLPNSVEVAAYYVVSEMLTNTAKHSQAKAVHVDVTQADEVLHIAVRDDGVGGADPARGSGLVGLRDRVEALGGTIALHSAKGAGTGVEVMLPLDRTAEASEQVQHAHLPQ